MRWIVGGGGGGGSPIKKGKVYAIILNSPPPLPWSGRSLNIYRIIAVWPQRAGLLSLQIVYSVHNNGGAWCSCNYTFNLGEFPKLICIKETKTKNITSRGHHSCSSLVPTYLFKLIRSLCYAYSREIKNLPSFNKSTPSLVVGINLGVGG